MANVGFWEGIVRDLGGRGLLGGKFQLRLILQPLIAVLLRDLLAAPDVGDERRALYVQEYPGSLSRAGLTSESQTA